MIENDINNFDDIVSSLERKCSIRLIDTNFDFRYSSTDVRIAIVEFEDSHALGLHLVELGPSKLIDAKLSNYLKVEDTELGKFIPRLVNSSTFPVKGKSMAVYELIDCSLSGLSTLRTCLNIKELNPTLVHNIISSVADALYRWNKAEALETQCYLKINNDSEWKQFANLTQELTRSLKLSESNQLLGDQALITWSLRERLSELVMVFSQKNNLQGNIELATWLAASIVGTRIALRGDSVGYSAIERKAALFYAANAFANILGHGEQGKADFRVKKSGHIQVVDSAINTPVIT